MRTTALWMLVAATASAGCDARLGATAQTAAGVDASGAITTSDAPGAGGSNLATPLDASPDANLCPSGRVVFLNFDGDTLTKAPTSDATQDEAVWIGQNGDGDTMGTLAMWRPNASDRATQIAAVLAGLQTLFATIAPEIAFVTTRPAAGPYVMIGFGGSNTKVGVPYTSAVNRLDCGDLSTKSDVAWVFEDVSGTTTVVNLAAGALAFGLGATGTTDPDDCMCGWLTDCAASGNPCTFSATADAQITCADQTNPQNDIAILQSFCN